MTTFKPLYNKIFATSNHNSPQWLIFLGESLGMFFVLMTVQLMVDIYHLYQHSGANEFQNLILISKEVDESNFNQTNQRQFNQSDISLLKSTKGITAVYPVEATHVPVYLSVGGFMETLIFFEGVDDQVIRSEVGSEWAWHSDSTIVPILIGTDLLQMYNFGFAPSQGLPALTEERLRSLPLTVIINQGIKYQAKVIGTNSQINSVLAPLTFVQQANGGQANPVYSRLLVQAEDAQALSSVLMSHHWQTNAQNSFLKKSGSMIRILFTVIIIIALLLLCLTYYVQYTRTQNQILENKKSISILESIGHPQKYIISYFTSSANRFSLVATLLALSLTAVFQWRLSAQLTSWDMCIPVSLSLWTVLLAFIYYISIRWWMHRGLQNSMKM